MTITADLPTPRRPAPDDGADRTAALGTPRAARRCWPQRRVLYLWGLGSSGWANSYYAAAAQAGTQD